MNNDSDVSYEGFDNSDMAGDGSIASAMDQMPDIEALEGGQPQQAPLDRSRDDQGRFTSEKRANDMSDEYRQNADFQDTDATLTSEHVPDADKAEAEKQAEAPQEADAADGEEEFIEWSDSDDENAEPQRIKLSEAVERIKEADQLKAELENVRQVQPAPPEYDQQIEQYMERSIALDQQLRQWQAFNAPQQPDPRLLTTGDPNDAQVYYAQLQHNEQLAAEHHRVAQQLQQNEQEYWHARETKANAQWQREIGKVYEKHPAMKQESAVLQFAADAEAMLGLDKETLDGLRDSRILNGLIELVQLKKAGQKAEAAQAKAVRAVKKTPKLVRNKRSASPQQARRSNALKRLQQSGSIEDAADALDGLLDI